MIKRNKVIFMNRSSASKILLCFFVLLGSVSLPAQESIGPLRQTNIVFVLDISGSMDWPTYLSESQLNLLLPEIKQAMMLYKTKLTELSEKLTEKEKEQFFAGCLYCAVSMEDGTYRDIPKLDSQNANYELAQEITSLREDLVEKTKELKISKLRTAKQSILSLLFLHELSKTLFENQFNTALVTFADYDSTENNFDLNNENLKNNLKNISTGSGTNISSGLDQAFFLIEYPEEPFPSSYSKTEIILLTDGRANDGLDPSFMVKTYVKKALDLNVKIFTIGFGIIEDEVDKNLLKNLAENTQATYSFAVTENELSQAFLRTWHATLTQTLVYHNTGTISQDEEKIIGTINPNYTTSELIITLNWPGSDLDLIIRDSAGNKFPETGYTLIKKDNVILVRMKNPPVQELKLIAIGKEVPEKTMEYNVIVSENKGSFRFLDLLKDNALIIIAGIAILGIGLMQLLKSKQRNNKSS